MTDVFLWVLGVGFFIIALALSIAVHEFGHLIVAKKVGVAVPKYAIGFGKVLYSRKVGDTDYSLRAIPLGGFVDVQDERQPEGSMERSLLSHINPLKRIAIFVAGPAVNLVIGTVLMLALLMTTPLYFVSSTVEGYSDACGVECPAKDAGILPGDQIVAMEGHPVENGSQIVGNFTNQSTMLKIHRNGVYQDIEVKPTESGIIGIQLQTAERNRGLGESVEMLGTMGVSYLHAIARIPEQTVEVSKAIVGVEERKPDSMASVVGVGRIYGETMVSKTIPEDSKITALLSYTAMFNFGLGVANLLPLLPLDGGRILIALFDIVKMGWAKIRRAEYKPTSNTTVGIMTATMAVFVIGFMAVMIVADIVAPITMG